MSTNDCDVARLRIRVAFGNVLLYRQVKHFFLGMSCSMGIFPYVLSFDSVLLDDECGCHVGSLMGCEEVTNLDTRK